MSVRTDLVRARTDPVCTRTDLVRVRIDLVRVRTDLVRARNDSLCADNEALSPRTDLVRVRNGSLRCLAGTGAPWPFVCIRVQQQAVHPDPVLEKATRTRSQDGCTTGLRGFLKIYAFPSPVATLSYFS